MTFATWLALGEIAWVLGLGTWIIMERRSPTATLAWIFALAWIPLLGIPIYLLIGPRRLRRKRLRYHSGKSRIHAASKTVRNDRESANTACSWGSQSSHPLALLNRKAGQPGLFPANHIELFTTGDDCYRSMEASIAEAKHHIHLEYYIWEPDCIGTRIRDLLCEKAKSGVEVRVLIDAIGSNRLGRGFVRKLRESGAEVAFFNPISVFRFPPSLVNFRTHKKLCLIDGEIGYLGGINICDAHSAQISGNQAWRDTHLRIDGPPVGCMQWAFFEDWQFANGSSPCSARYFPEMPVRADAPLVQTLTSGPDTDTYAIEQFVFAAIAQAQKRILVTTPYFVPNEGLLRVLTTAAMRGVDVRLLVPKRGDLLLVAAAGRSYYEELARFGVRIYEYGPAMLHAKTLIIDDDISMVGTANMDNRSFRLNFEIAAVFFDRGIAASLKSHFREDMRSASRYRMRDARREPFFRRLFESIARLLSPLL